MDLILLVGGFNAVHNFRCNFLLQAWFVVWAQIQISLVPSSSDSWLRFGTGIFHCRAESILVKIWSTVPKNHISRPGEKSSSSFGLVFQPKKTQELNGHPRDQRNSPPQWKSEPITMHCRCMSKKILIPLVWFSEEDVGSSLMCLVLLFLISQSDKLKFVVQTRDNHSRFFSERDYVFHSGWITPGTDNHNWN